MDNAKAMVERPFPQEAGDCREDGVQGIEVMPTRMAREKLGRRREKKQAVSGKHM
jgi:hypothetical protein